MLLLIDNYDSFVYNLAHDFEREGETVRVVRNDAITLDEIERLAPGRIVISPGPCSPAEAGISIEVIRRFGPRIPTLGVCLGHQAIGAAFGGHIVRAKAPVHGKTSDIDHIGVGVFAGVEKPLTVGRYHSLVIERETLPDELEITAEAPDGEIMGVRHRTYPIEGVQFHPESVLTSHGRRIVRNFLSGGRPRMLIRDAIARVLAGDNLSVSGAEDVMEDVMSGVATPAQIAAWLVAMRIKGETPEEIAACVRVMRRFARPIRTDRAGVVDTCGTGGDDAGTFNISTVAALAVAGAGVPVVKHGNRAVSSRCGSADLFAELGVQIACPPERMERALAEAGIAFAFAPIYHQSMKHAAEPRREIGMRTLFNILGPMTNPAGAKRQVIGVYDRALTRHVAEVLRLLGTEHAMVVHGHDGLDEITLTGPTHVAELRGGEITEYEFDPRDVGLTLCEAGEFAGGHAGINRRIAERILAGGDGPQADIVALNAGAALVVSGKAADVREGIEIARESLRSGRARAALVGLARISHDDGA
ncbi:bifunctional anthranilate synthase component II/anthranilate phosphoribosyltransferase [bacterium]|nr:bifunctional anthranilate synthase component II/anthranilate phosphoribosyltransferase [bacterium]